MDNVVEVTIVAEGSDGQCILSDHWRGEHINFYRIKNNDCLICTLERAPVQ